MLVRKQNGVTIEMIFWCLASHCNWGHFSDVVRKALIHVELLLKFPMCFFSFVYSIQLFSMNLI